MTLILAFINAMVANVAMEVLWAAMFWDVLGRVFAVCRFAFWEKIGKRVGLLLVSTLRQ